MKICGIELKGNDAILVSINTNGDTFEILESKTKKTRAKKGKFAGGSVSFKIEGILQNSSYPVHLYSGAKMKSKLKNKEIDTTTINAYQVEALRAAICLGLDSQ